MDKVKRWLKIAASSIAILFFIAVLLWAMTPQSWKQKAYDTKADLIGTHRIANVYTQETGILVETYEDDSMRFELVGERSVRLWLGDASKKVMVINMGVTIADQ